MARLFRMKEMTSSINHKNQNEQIHLNKDTQITTEKNKSDLKEEYEFDISKIADGNDKKTGPYKKNFRDEEELVAVSHLLHIEDLLKETKEENEHERHLEDEELKFKFAALVMNRFFFFAAILYFVIAFCSVIMPAANFYKSR